MEECLKFTKIWVAQVLREQISLLEMLGHQSHSIQKNSNLFQWGRKLRLGDCPTTEYVKSKLFIQIDMDVDISYPYNLQALVNTIL